MLNIGKRFTFDAAHYIEGHPTCGKMHGHTWTLDVELIDCQTRSDGFVIDFKVLGGIVKDILKHYDHQVLNEVVVLRTITAETLAEHFARCITTRVYEVVGPVAYKHIRIRLQEGTGGWAEYTLEVR